MKRTSSSPPPSLPLTDLAFRFLALTRHQAKVIYEQKPTRFQSEHTHIVQIDTGKVRCIGLGIADSKERSLGIAVAECIERIALNVYASRKKRYVSSNGFALHTSRKLAVQTAICELVERDAFFFHYLTGRAFQKIQLPKSFRIQKSSKIKQVGLVKMSTIPGYQSYLGWVRTSRGGLHIGAACGPAGANSLIYKRKALSEALFGGNAHRSLTPLKKSEMHLLDQGPHQHVRAALNPAFTRDFYEKFLSRSQPALKQSPRKIRFQIEDVDLKGSRFEKFPLHIVRATSPDLQDLFWGEAEHDKINWHRFARHSVSLDQLKTPHLFP